MIFIFLAGYAKWVLNLLKVLDLLRDRYILRELRDLTSVTDRQTDTHTN